MPGYTHLQRAIPVTVGHHLLAWVEMLERDLARFAAADAAAAPSPLGSGALAGSTLPLPPPAGEQVRNSLDAVADRDFALDYLYACAVLFTHLSRIGEELVLWSTSEFGFVRLPESAATGSSMMPQKLNPDVAELVRGKAGTMIGRLTGLLAVVKGLPLAYDRDLQEDKPPVFAARRDVRLALAALSVLVEGLDVRPRSGSPPRARIRCCARPTRPRRWCAKACRSATRTSRSPSEVRAGHVRAAARRAVPRRVPRAAASRSRELHAVAAAPRPASQRPSRGATSGSRTRRGRLCGRIRPRRGCAASTRAARRRCGPRAPRGSPRGSRAPSRPACARRGRGRPGRGSARAHPRRRPPRAAARAASPGSAASRSRRCRTRRSRARPTSAGMSNFSSCVRTTTAVAWSGRTRASASSGHATISSSALGTRSASRSVPRASATIVRQPSAFAARAQRLGGVDRAEDEQPRRRPEHVREDASPVELDDARMPAAQQLVGLRVLALDHEPLRAVSRSGEDDRAPIAESASRESSSGSASRTNTSISPPHGSPTSNAWSSEIPYVTRRGASPRSTARHTS